METSFASVAIQLLLFPFQWCQSLNTSSGLVDPVEKKMNWFNKVLYVSILALTINKDISLAPMIVDPLLIRGWVKNSTEKPWENVSEMKISSLLWKHATSGAPVKFQKKRETK